MTETTLDVSTLQPLLDALAKLSPEAELTLTNGTTPVAKVTLIKTHSAAPRVPDLHPGVWLSDDFNDVLPDHYWRTRSL